MKNPKQLSCSVNSIVQALLRVPKIDAICQSIQNCLEESRFGEYGRFLDLFLERQISFNKWKAVVGDEGKLDSMVRHEASCVFVEINEESKKHNHLIDNTLSSRLWKLFLLSRKAEKERQEEATLFLVFLLDCFFATCRGFDYKRKRSFQFASFLLLFAFFLFSHFICTRSAVKHNTS